MKLIKRTLAQHEEIIADGMKSFLYVGQALMAIRDEGLYQDNFETFEAYCKSRWGFNRAHAYRLIEAADVVSDLSPIGDTQSKVSKQTTQIPLPKTESQARAIAGAADTPEDRRAVWEKVVEVAPKNDAGEPIITAKLVSQVADEIVGPKNTPPAPPKAKPVVAEVVSSETEFRPGFDPRQFDPEMKSEQEETPEPTGEIPPHLVEVVAGIKAYESFRRKLSLLKNEVLELLKLPIGSYIRWQDAELHIDQVKADFKAASFGENCPDCQNKPNKKCLRCKGRGWIAQGQMGSLSDEHKAWLEKHGVSK